MGIVEFFSLVGRFHAPNHEIGDYSIIPVCYNFPRGIEKKRGNARFGAILSEFQEGIS